ncbi:MAG: guanylate kinase [Endomicrobium sp.]|jgi:guanylate kinase|nr:guanylate kinase [Endomicrobium sp.]
MSEKLNNPIKLGNIIIVSAPSGAGKSSICDAVLASDKENITYSISYTTRSPRKGEKNGKNYFFVSEENFKKMIEEDKFVEWAKVHDNYYGTSKEFLEKVLDEGKNIILEIDVQGGIKIKNEYPDRSCMIFVMTPDFKTLEERLIARNKDCRDSINMRMINAKKELEYLPQYEYLVINKDFSIAVESVKTIIASLKYRIQKDTIYFV